MKCFKCRSKCEFCRAELNEFDRLIVQVIPETRDIKQVWYDEEEEEGIIRDNVLFWGLTQSGELIPLTDGLGLGETNSSELLFDLDNKFNNFIGYEIGIKKDWSKEIEEVKKKYAMHKLQ